MTKPYRRNGRSSNWMRTLVRTALIALCAALARQAPATGYYGPAECLSRWKNLVTTPEFYWQLEVKRLAANYHPPEKLMLARLDPQFGGNGFNQDQASATYG